MKTRLLLVALALVVASVGRLFGQGVPLKVELCTLTERPEQFNGMLVDVRARLTDLKDREWAMDDVCFRPVLIVLRSDSKSPPEIYPSKAPILDVLSKSLSERVVVFANFIGRFEWSGSASTSRRAESFGRSRSPMRLVLRDVTDVERIVVPRK